MATYVLVGGAWLGGWAWGPVTARLRERGHDVYPATLTGLGERAHLATTQTNLDTHIADVVNLIEYEDLRDVILVGHSYAGIVVTGVADRVPERISMVTYLDSGPAPDGATYIDFQPPPARELVERLVEGAGDGWQLPLPSWDELESTLGASLEGMGADERSVMSAGAVAHPFGTWMQPLSLKNPARDDLRKLLISCSFPLAQVREMIAAGHPWFQELASPTWSFLELPTGHWPMFSVPEQLAELLDSV